MAPYGDRAIVLFGHVIWAQTSLYHNKRQHCHELESCHKSAMHTSPPSHQSRYLYQHLRAVNKAHQRSHRCRRQRYSSLMRSSNEMKATTPSEKEGGIYHLHMRLILEVSDLLALRIIILNINLGASARYGFAINMLINKPTIDRPVHKVWHA